MNRAMGNRASAASRGSEILRDVEVVDMNTESERVDGFRITSNGYDIAQVDAFVFELFVRLHDATRRIEQLEGSPRGAADVVPLRRAS